MPLRRIIIGMALAFAASAAAYGLWLEAGARREGFAHLLDRRAAHASGILDAGEWRAMQAAGDLGAPAAGGEACLSAACRRAEAVVGGRWRGGADCAVGNVYRFTDGAAVIDDMAGEGVTGTARRRYRLVAAAVRVPIRAGGDGRPLDASVEKRPGDIEVWTLGASAYVRRIFRRTDPETVMLLLVQNRVGGAGPVHTLYADGRSTTGGGEVAYRRCHPKAFG